ncbi:cytochrome P450 [Microthyrium microscopicum]|uniref:Bifunctional cytochrome P450/NADPH--P450 reductase n=1 Tax=Microthyrium microscopicum TaxID=703497 RepID=A0A6A6U784_9PEZI|nr:cytochrome P450 [Microthyrium microscopicum]
MAGIVPIPEPPALPFLGNITDIDQEFPLGSFIRMADTYGEIYKLHLGSRSIVVISSQALLNEVCNEKRFSKKVSAALSEIRNGVHDGLFTATGPEEPNWGKAHRVLVPAFGPMPIHDMFDEMHDIASQLALKWARHGPSHQIQVTDDFTRLTLDTLALCAMDFRFNSFYSEELHPFIEAMGDFLVESGQRSRRTLPAFWYRKKDQKFQADIDILRKTSDDVLKERKANPSDRKDLLGAMLKGKDPKTGEGLSDSSITDNLITFLIAGHETTSGLLSFVFYQLLKHPETYQQAQKEIDEVIGTGPIKIEHMSKLPYINAVLRETLRLCATIPIIALQANEDTVIGGKYAIKGGEPILCLLAKVHLDPAVYGEDANEFVPERMLDENFDRLNKEFPNSWKPFGNGARGCIGRPFAWQEALLVMALLMQNFNFTMDDPSYHLSYKQTLTIKPKGFHMRASLRRDMIATQLERNLMTSIDTSATKKRPATSNVGPSKVAKATGKPMRIFYGSNSGTCESLAQRLATDASRHGFLASTVDALDTLNGKLPTGQPVVIITASYEGQPPDNAAHFVASLENLKGEELKGIDYAVFGCGHHDWAQTFHRIPKLVNEKMAAHGASRIAELGLSDAAKGDMFTDFETWEDQLLWPAMIKKYEIDETSLDEGFESALTVDVLTPRSSTLRQDVKEAVVVAVKDLTAPSEPAKKHVEIKLPSDSTYEAGDYLAILPINPKEVVQRAMRKFELAWDSHLSIEAVGPTLLPTDSTTPASDVFGAYVELAQPATKRNILALIPCTNDPTTKTKLQNLADAAYATEISAKRVSLLDLLDTFPTISLPLASFLSMLPPMRIRQYSISSSPLWNPRHVTLTYAVLDAPSLADPAGHRHVGVASNYLAGLAPGDKLHVAVRKSNAAFHLPHDAEHMPLLLVAAGTGIAPFRGFIQERAAQVGAGRALAPAVLWFGCRAPGADDLYAEELARWEKMGAIEVRRAYSREPEKSDGCKYVQDRLWADRERVAQMWKEGGRVFVCGSREVGEAVGDVARKIMMETVREKEIEETGASDINEERAKKWFESVRNVRYATDVFV